MSATSSGVFDLIDRFADIPTVSALWGEYLGAARRAGFQHGLAFFVDNENSLLQRSFCDGMPCGWLDQYSAAACERIDPVHAQIQVCHTPFTWRLRDWAGSESCRRWYSLNQDAGVHTGFIISDHSGSHFRSIALVGPDVEIHPHDRMALHLAGLELLRRTELLGVRPPGHHDALHLSDRERECLQWVADGKTDWEIGQILSISEKTVNAYIERVKHKLDVQTRPQALVVAIRRRLINI
jgi:DNA-binding CsgD family transcriptional regulator